MSNSLFQALGGGAQPNMMQQFQTFVQQMQGRDPRAMIQELVSSGRVSQAQLDLAQRQAQQMSGVFEPMRSMFQK